MTEFFQDDDKKLFPKFVSMEHEFKDVLKGLESIIHFGGKKHGYGSYLDDDNPSLQHKANCASLHRHLSSFTAGDNIDSDSGRHHLELLAVRAIMTLKGIQSGLPGREKDEKHTTQSNDPTDTGRDIDGGNGSES